MEIEDEKFEPCPLVDAAMATEMWEVVQCVERWAHGEGIELSPSIKRKMKAIRKKIKAAQADPSNKSGVDNG